MGLPTALSIFGSLASAFGGKKDKGSSSAAPAPQAQPEKKQVSVATTANSEAKRARASQRSDLVSGRPGTTTRSGVNIPGGG